MASRRRASRPGPAAAVGMALIIGMLVAPTAVAKSWDCVTFNDAEPGVTYDNLQAAVDAAADGDTVRVEGTCIGTTIVGQGITIAGGHKATLDGGHSGRVLEITASSATLIGLRIVNGSTDGDGGGILHGPGTLTVIDTTVMGNVAGGQGGGIGGELWLTLVNSKVVGNSAFAGGGIGGLGDLTLSDSIVSGNGASFGGGIAVSHATTTLNGNSEISGNAATDGGGVMNVTSAITLNDDSSIRDNTASAEGAGIYSSDATTRLYGTSSISGNAAGGDGGGVYSLNSWTILADSSSIRKNSASGYGGGVANATFLPFQSILRLEGSSSIELNSATEGGGVYNGETNLVELADSSSVQHNVASGNGGGIWTSKLGLLTNCLPGSNVVRNHPGDVFIEP